MADEMKRRRPTKSQLKRIALAVEAHYLLAGAETGCIRENLREEDEGRFNQIQMDLAMKWFREAGIEPCWSLKAILIAILGPEYADYFYTDPCSADGYED